MLKNNIMKIAVVCKKAESARDFALSLTSWLKAEGCEVFDLDKIKKPLLGFKLVVVIGGDGTLLHAVRLLRGHSVPIIGINMGGLGFLTEINKGDAKAAIEAYFQGKCSLSERMMCEVNLFRDSRQIIHQNVLNDVVITKGKIARMIEMEVNVDDVKLNRYRADGLILSTPTGSTAYVLSAGGPIVAPDLQCMIVCPICPHTLTNRPVVIAPNATLSVVIISEKDVYLTLDGQRAYPLKKDDKIIVRKSESKVLLVKYKNFFEILQNKMHWGDR